MDPKLHVRIVAYFIEANATYSDVQRAHTISLPDLAAIYDRIVRGEPADLSHQMKLEDALQMGARDGLWTLRYDQAINATVVVLG